MLILRRVLISHGTLQTRKYNLSTINHLAVFKSRVRPSLLEFSKEKSLRDSSRRRIHTGIENFDTVSGLYVYQPRLLKRQRQRAQAAAAAGSSGSGSGLKRQWQWTPSGSGSLVIKTRKKILTQRRQNVAFFAPQNIVCLP